jgi:hypothetical protein
LPPILSRIDGRGQAPSPGRDLRVSPAVEAFVARALELTDDERIAVAEARRAVDEDFHEKALRAGVEALAGRGEEYLRARAQIARAHLPEGLTSEDALSPDERARWNEVARLVQLGLDEGLIAILGTPVLHPNHLRELHRSLKVAWEPG